MNTRLNRKPSLIAAGAAAVLFFSANSLSLAQDTGGQGRANGGNAPGQLTPGQIPNVTGAILNSPMGAQLGDMLNKMRQKRGFVDPGISNTANLLTRADVRNELFLNGRQTETVANLQNGYPAAMMSGIMTTVMSSIQKMQQDGGNLDPRSMSPDERQQMITEMRDKMTESVTAVQADQDKKAEAVLTPAQIKRLKELDLQWRGPLALSDEKLADKVGLNPEQRTQFKTMLKELRDARMKAQSSAFMPGGGGFPGLPGATSTTPATKPQTGKPGTGSAQRQTGKNGGQATGPATPAPPAPATPPDAAPNLTPGPGGFTPPTPEQIQQASEAAAKQSEAALKAMDKKALLLLTPEQQTQWKLLQGKPFTFRQYL